MTSRARARPLFATTDMDVLREKVAVRLPEIVTALDDPTRLIGGYGGVRTATVLPARTTDP